MKNSNPSFLAIAFCAIVLALLSAALNACHASEALSAADKIRESLVLTTYAIDCLQTLDIKNHPGMREINPVLGEHPSDKRIVGYFAVMSVLHVGIARALPEGWRGVWQYSTIAFEIAVINRNKTLGIRIRF